MSAAPPAGDRTGSWRAAAAVAALIAVAIAWPLARAADAPGPTVPASPAPSPAASPAIAASPVDAARLFADRCASCHGVDRFGGMGPALLPESLERLKRPAAAETIAQGRAATQMPRFGDVLTKDEIAALVAYVYAPPATPPAWSAADIAASRVVHRATEPRIARPAYDADPLNLFVVVEAGDHHASVVDGDRFVRLARFPTRYALHGGPKFTPDGRYVYFGSRDGWITKYDLWTLENVVEVRAGLNMRNIAVSADGRYVIAGNYLPRTLVIFNAADLTIAKVIPVAARNGATSRVSAVYDAAPRESFIVALKDVPEIWEIPYGAKAEPVYEGYVHDYRMGEGLATKGPFPVRRIELDDVLDDFFFDARYDHVIGASRDGGKGQVVNLNVRRRIATLDLPGLPHLGSGIGWTRDGQRLMATTNLKEGVVTVIDTATWKPVANVQTLGPGFFLRSHEASPYAWVDSMMGTKRDTLQVIDKRTLAIVGSVTPSPGKTAAHVEFDRYGRYAVVSVWEDDGALVVYDARTLAEVKRLPASKPVGKYNVWNKVTRDEGTSH